MIQRNLKSGFLSILFALIVTLGLSTGAEQTGASTNAKNVILFVGDGMGEQHVRAGGMYAYGAEGTLSFEQFPYQTTMTHNNAYESVTDSAAAATSMATGAKVSNGTISVNQPGGGAELETALEMHKLMGRRTGLITTSYITDATPAAFGAHETTRGNRSQIAADYLYRSRPNVLLGGRDGSFSSTTATTLGYIEVEDKYQLASVDTENTDYLVGEFGNSEIPPAETPGRDSSLPELKEMVATALDVLDNGGDGFFLVVEHEGTDTHSHANDRTKMTRSVKEIHEAVQLAVNWQANNPDTLIVVTADHECGGLVITEGNPRVGDIPNGYWTTGGHTAAPVPVFAKGVGADQVTSGQLMDNTDIFDIIKPNIPPVIQAQVMTSADDAEERLSDGIMNLISPDLELGEDTGGPQVVGLRFNNVRIPSGSVIDSAYIEFEADETHSDPTVVTIYVHDMDNAPAFTSTPYDITNRPLLYPGIIWPVSAWYSEDVKHRSPDLAPIIAEVMSRPGWSPGNSLSFEIYGSGRRAAESQDGESVNAPTLNFEYTRYIPTSVDMGQQSALQQRTPITAVALFLMLTTIFYLTMQVVYKPKD